MGDHVAVVSKMSECYNSMNADGLRDVLHPECRHTTPGSADSVIGADPLKRKSSKLQPFRSFGYSAPT